MKARLPDSVDSKEVLYRVLKRSRPEFIDQTTKSVSPALFKDARGVSVDRDGGRMENEVIRFIREETFKGRTKAVVSVTAAQCYEINADIRPAPSEVNPYHANIFLDAEFERKRNLQALKLADCCKLVFFDEDVQWVEV